jgi:hypothetical protein
MKTLLVAALLGLSAPAAFAADPSPISIAQADPTPAVVRVSVPPKAVKSAEPTPEPSPTPAITEPQTQQEFVQLLLVFALAAQRAAALGTLGAILVAALALTYILMYLAKNALKGQIPEHYKKVLKPALVVLTGVAAGIGYYLGGPPAAVAAGVGAAGSSVAHDLIDSLRYGPAKR